MIKLLYVTTSNKAEAQKIGKELLEKRLAACVNIIDDMQSMYWWEGEIQESSEVVLLIKTREENISNVQAVVENMHSYDCPCVLTLSVEGGNLSYIKWLCEIMVKNTK